MILKYLKAFRFVEVFILTGFVLIGAVFSVSTLNQAIAIKTFVLFCIAFSAIGGLYAFNGHQGHQEDKNNERLRALSEIPNSAYLIFFAVFYGASLLLGFVLDPRVGCLVFLLGIFGIGYSIKGVGKDRPLTGTAIHLFFQIVAFHIGYLAFGTISSVSMFISMYFSLLYMAGHLHHQVIDFEADRDSGTQTGAVKWGIEKAERFSLLLFTISAGYWIALFFRNIIDYNALIPFLLAYGVQLILFLRLHDSFENSKDIDYTIDRHTGYYILLQAW